MSNVISEKQQKNTLRGKKGKKGTVKNVLTSPYTHYWPLLKNEDDTCLKRILKSNLPRIREPKRNVPWDQIKVVPKEERRAYRKKLSDLASKPVDPPSKYMYFGINEVTKLLEKDDALSVLLSNDVSPHLMIKHLVDLCVFKRVPILILSDFKDFLKEVTGISPAAIAFKKSTAVPATIDLVLKAIDDTFIKYPIPPTHAAFKGESNFFTPASNIDTTIKKKDPELKKGSDDVYLYRDSNSSGRVFIPNNSNRKHRLDKMEVDCSGFMSFGEVTAADTYKSLIVKQVVGNPDRNKRKLQMIRNRKKKQKMD